jgi:hypothetical protein
MSLGHTHKDTLRDNLLIYLMMQLIEYRLVMLMVDCGWSVGIDPVHDYPMRMNTLAVPYIRDC